MTKDSGKKLHPSKHKMLDAALRLIREKGYEATRIEDICEAASVTKGSFFHHFKSKQELALAAAQYWSDVTGALFEDASYNALQDPLDRVLGYIDFRRKLISGEVAEFTCLVGTMVQEIYASEPEIREACNRSISEHADRVAKDIRAAMKRYGIKAEWTAESLALHTQAVLQGAFILAKAKGDGAIAKSSIDHLRRYVEFLFREAD